MEQKRDAQEIFAGESRRACFPSDRFRNSHYQEIRRRTLHQPSLIVMTLYSLLDVDEAIDLPVAFEELDDDFDDDDLDFEDDDDFDDDDFDDDDDADEDDFDFDDDDDDFDFDDDDDLDI